MDSLTSVFTPSTPSRANQPMAAAEGSASAMRAADPARAPSRAKALDMRAPPAEATGGGNSALATRDLSHKPLPTWARDPFNTQVNLELHRLFAPEKPASAAKALRRYAAVGGA